MIRLLLVFGVAAAMGAAAGGAAADLYRWIDPETGSVKFSNIPPPWFGRPELQRRAPKVEHIPERQRPAMAEGEAPPVAAATRAPAGQALEPLEARRKQLLLQVAAAAGNPGPAPQKLMEEYVQLLGEMDKLDPKGSAARQAETQAVLEKFAKGTQR